MDTYSAASAARELGTTTPRVVRAVHRLGLGSRHGGRYVLSRTDVDALQEELGSVVPAGLTRTQARVLAALAQAPRGLASVRTVARAAGTSPTGTATALRSLVERGLAQVDRMTVAMGRAVDVDVYRVGRDSRSPAIAAAMGSSSGRNLPPRRGGVMVPLRLRHLFWNTATAQLDVRTSAGYIAQRLLRTMDLDGLAWGADHIPAEAWRWAARSRSLDPKVRVLALNLARSAS